MTQYVPIILNMRIDTIQNNDQGYILVFPILHLFQFHILAFLANFASKTKLNYSVRLKTKLATIKETLVFL